jgi:hypothetical protein
MKHIKILFVLSVILFNSCQNERLPEPTNAKVSNLNDSVTIEEIKQFYSNLKKGRKTSDGKEAEEYIFWEDAKESKRSNGETIISVPFVSDETAGVSIRNDYEPKKSVDYTADVKSNLIFIKTREELKLNKFYLVRDEKEYIDRENKSVSQDDFTGYSILKDQDGKLIELVTYDMGKPVASSNPENKRNSRTNDVMVICVDYFSVACFPSVGECGPPIWIYTDCIEIFLIGGIPSVSYPIYNTTLGGGGGSGVSSLNAFQNVDGFWEWVTGLNSVEQEYYLNKPHLIQRAIQNRRVSKRFVESIYCFDIDNNNSNAFKHAFFSALNAYTFGMHIAREIGENHESDPNNDIYSKEMDLHNNLKGYSIYSQNAALLQGKTLLEVHYILAEKVLIAVKTGVLRKIDYSGTSPVLVPTNSDDICI